MRLVLVAPDLGSARAHLVRMMSDGRFDAPSLVFHSLEEESWDQLAPLMHAYPLFGGVTDVHVVVTTSAGERDDVIDQFLIDGAGEWVLVVSSLPAVLKTRITKKGAHLEEVVTPKAKTKSSDGPNVFALTDALARGNKKDRWVLYTSLIREGATPEQLIGILFWKLKTDFGKVRGFERAQIRTRMRTLVRALAASREGGAPLVHSLEEWLLSYA